MLRRRFCRNDGLRGTMEKWDILNGDGETVGRTAIRGQTSLKSGEYHLVVHIWVVSESGAFLIQRRSENKKLMPGEWAAIGGSAISGETSYCAAQRELLEEMGLPLVARQSQCLRRIKKRNSFVDVWMTKCQVHVSDLQLQKSEVADAKWVSARDLLRMVEKGQFHNYGKDYFDTLIRMERDFLYEHQS